MNIGIPIIATGRYFPMVDPLVASIRRHFKVDGAEIIPIILTESQEPLPDGCGRLFVEHKPWPHPTLKRWHMILSHWQILKYYDHLIHMDVDMKFVDAVGAEMIAPSIGVLSPVGHDWPKERLPFERNPASCAYVPPGGGERYYCGSVNGGKPDVLFGMAAQIVRGVDEDERAGYVAKYHEESHLNRWYWQNPPAVTLTPEYCAPQGATLRPKYTGRKIETLYHPELDKLKK